MRPKLLGRRFPAQQVQILRDRVSAETSVLGGGGAGNSRELWTKVMRTRRRFGEANLSLSEDGLWRLYVEHSTRNHSRTHAELHRAHRKLIQ